MSTVTKLPKRKVNTPSSTAAGSDSRAVPKGQQTKATIVDAAMGLATHLGLEGLSIGVVAEMAHMSKSGVFAHFGSREELQISVVREYFNQFEQEVFYPALAVPRGLPRLRALFEQWMRLVAGDIQAGCIFISGAVEFDDRPGPVRDALAGSASTLLTAVLRAVEQAQEMGHLSAKSDAHQIAFELHGLILALHYEARFLKNDNTIARTKAGFDHVLERYATQPSSK